MGRKEIGIKSEPKIVEKISEDQRFEKISNLKWSEAQIDAFVEKDILGKLYPEKTVFQKKRVLRKLILPFHQRTVQQGAAKLML